MTATFEMYTDAGDKAVEKALAKLGQTPTNRPQLLTKLAKALAPVIRAHPEVCDTEPEWAIVDWVNTNICDPNGLVHINRDDLYDVKQATRHA